MDKKEVKEPETAKEDKVEKKQTVEVDADVLQKILARQDAQDKELKTLRAAGNQNKILDVENKAKPKELPRVFLKGFMGKTVIGWKSEKAEYIYSQLNPSGSPVGEVLKATYYFSDGTDSGIVDQVLFFREDVRVWGRVLEGLKGLLDSDVKEVTVQLETLESADEELRNRFVMPSQPIKVHKTFLNP